MTGDSPRLTRSAFGYNPSVVDALLGDQRAMLATAERRVREAEAAAARLEEKVAAQEAAIAQLREGLAAASQAAQAPPAPEEAPLSPQLMSEELSKIISAAEETTNQILERARVSTRGQILEADRLWRDVQEEATKFAAWRDTAQAWVSGLQSVIHQARERIEAVPHRIQEALAPAVETMVQVDDGLREFAATSALPALLTPSEFEGAREASPGEPVEEPEASEVSDVSDVSDVSESSWFVSADSTWPAVDETDWSADSDELGASDAAVEGGHDGEAQASLDPDGAAGSFPEEGVEHFPDFWARLRES
jgi:cell division septum initiation protein DivIVA